LPGDLSLCKYSYVPFPSPCALAAFHGSSDSNSCSWTLYP
jgi:hypothetical protein